MPITQVLVIAPVAKIGDVNTVLGLNPTTPIFTSADTPPRTETHRAGNGGVTVPEKNVGSRARA